jgi:DNA helicase-2/ATP-dependent DNA helicase PcrA
LLDRPRVAALVAALPARSEGSLDELLAAACATSSGNEPDEWRAALELVAPLAARAGNDRRRLIAELACSIEVDTWDPRAARVALLTLHASKGLEFDCVFIPGCEDGILPLRFSPRTQPDAARGAAAADAAAEVRAEAEERRLFYVGMTRARRRLFLTYARSRRWLGQVRQLRPSPFSSQLPAACLELSRASFEARPAARQLQLF